VAFLVIELAIDWRETRFYDKGRGRFGLSSVDVFDLAVEE